MARTTTAPATPVKATAEPKTPAPMEPHSISRHLDPPEMPSKKRKATYLLRKEESASLKMQVEALQQEVTEIKLYGTGVPAKLRSEVGLLKDALTANSLLDRVVQEQHAAIASLQSMLAQYQADQPNHPLCTYIHLPKAPAERREVLLRLKDELFARGCKYLLTRSGHMNLLKRHSSENWFEDDDDSIRFERFHIRQFYGAKSLRQVFDATMFAESSMEIIISEKLGHLTLREDYDRVEGDASISNFRLVSDLPDGLTYEASKVVWAQYFDQREGSDSGPCAIMAVDFIDKDDLYPYKPTERMRKDVTAVIVLTAVKGKKVRSSSTAGKRSRGGDKEEEEGLVVVMQHMSFVKIHKPDFEVSPQTLSNLQDAVAGWGDMIVQTAKCYVDASP